MEHVEQLTGKGQLLEDEATVLEVQYAVDVYSTPSTAGLIQIVGFISGAVSWELIPLVGKSLTLRLEDGRRWDCVLEDASGTLIGTGGQGFYKTQD